MRILLDMNISPKWVDLLAANGHTVVHWSSVGSAGAEDRDIMAWARAKGYSVMTSDLDFGDILAVTGGKLPSVIQLRDGRNEPSEMLPLVLEALKQSEAALENGALVSIDHRRHRLKLLPLTQGPEN